MSLRDYFAGQAAAGMCMFSGKKIEELNEGIAKAAYMIADAMLKERDDPSS